MTTQEMMDWSYRLREAVYTPEFYRMTVEDQVRFRKEAMKAAHAEEAGEWLMKRLRRIEAMDGK